MIAEQVHSRPANGGGRDMWLRVADITIDPRYQRIASQAQIDRMAADWNPDLAGAIEVSHRKTGRYVALDGQGRTLAARKASVEFIRAIVHEDMSLEEEAARFVALNTLRTRPKAVDIFNARLVAGDPVAIGVVGTVEEVGLHVSRHGGGKKPYGHIEAVGTLESVYRVGGPSALGDTLRVIVTAWPQDPDALVANLIAGVGAAITFYRGYPGFNLEILTKRLAKRPARAVVQRGHALASGSPASGGGVLSSGHLQAVVEAYNRGAQKTLPAITKSQAKRLSLGQNIWSPEGSES